MRIISSECDYDAPYDKCFLSIRESNISGKFQIIASQYMTKQAKVMLWGTIIQQRMLPKCLIH